MAESDSRGMLLGPEEQEVILCRFKGGQVTLLDFAETYNAYWFIRSVSFDSSGIAEFIHWDLLPRTLVYQAGVAGRLGPRFNHRGLVAGNKKKSLLLEALRREEVVERTEVDSVMARQYYDDHPQQFMELEEIQVAEVLVATRAEAEQLLQLVRTGERLETLAARHTLRTDTEGGHGQYHIHYHPSERRVFGAFLRFGGRRAGGSAHWSCGPRRRLFDLRGAEGAFPRAPRPLHRRLRGRGGGCKSGKKRPFSTPCSPGSGINTPTRVVVFEEQLGRLDASPASP